jgi:hypothetical protein
MKIKLSTLYVDDQDKALHFYTEVLADSHYESTRNRNWLKVKCAKQQEFVIAGDTPSSKGLPEY